MITPAASSAARKSQHGHVRHGHAGRRERPVHRRVDRRVTPPPTPSTPIRPAVSSASGRAVNARLDQPHPEFDRRDVPAERPDGVQRRRQRVHALHRHPAPYVVLRPTTPQHAAGTRTEPPVSVPNATSASPVATATADPLEDPPGTRARVPRVHRRPRPVVDPAGRPAQLGERGLADDPRAGLAGRRDHRRVGVRRAPPSPRRPGIPPSSAAPLRRCSPSPRAEGRRLAVRIAGRSRITHVPISP